MDKKLLDYRDKIKKKKPDYLRQDGHRYSRLKKIWRRPKGIHSKMRRGLGSYRKSPEIGYGSPKKVRGLSRDGLRLVLIKNLRDLKNVGKDSLLVISGKIGLKKKLEILKRIEKDNLKAWNIDVRKFLEDYKKKEEDKKSKKKEKANPEKGEETPKKEVKTKENKKEKELKKKVLEKKQ